MARFIETFQCGGCREEWPIWEQSSLSPGTCWRCCQFPLAAAEDKWVVSGEMIGCSFGQVVEGRALGV